MTNTNRNALAAGLSLAVTPLVLQVPFGLLAAKYDYPDILLRDAGEVLTRFHDAGPGMVWTWWFYALCTLGLFVAALTVPDALGMTGSAKKFSTATGLVASFAQLLGLLRWVFVVPYLAQAWVEHAADQQTLRVVFETQHRLFGVLLGEHVGQLFMALWTASVALHLANKVLRGLGLLSAATLLLGLGAGLARAVPMPALVTHAPLIGFLAWVIWAVATGVVLLRTQLNTAAAQPLVAAGQATR
ncbi:MAG: DUF4386 family protein [Archangium sp.]